MPLLPGLSRFVIVRNDSPLRGGRYDNSLSAPQSLLIAIGEWLTEIVTPHTGVVLVISRCIEMFEEADLVLSFLTLHIPLTL